MPTNTIAGVLAGTTGSFSNAYDTVVNIAVVTLGIAIVLGLVSRWMPKRRKAG